MGNLLSFPPHPLQVRVTRKWSREAFDNRGVEGRRRRRGRREEREATSSNLEPQLLTISSFSLYLDSKGQKPSLFQHSPETFSLARSMKKPRDSN